MTITLNDLKDPKLFGKSLNDKDVYISKMTATRARKILVMYPSGLYQSFKEKNYDASEQICLELLAHSAVEIEPNQLMRLETPALIDNFIDPKQIMILEKALFEHTFGFFPIGDFLVGLEGFASKIEGWAVKTATRLLQQSSKVDSQPSMN